jgi:hypothetical protein
MYPVAMLSSRIHPLQTARPYYTHSLQKVGPSKGPIPVKYAAKTFLSVKTCVNFLYLLCFSCQIQQVSHEENEKKLQGVSKNEPAV